MDTSTVCPVCMRENAISNGYCRFCRKKINLDAPTGVLMPGTVLHGRYLTGMCLGQGGFGTIYKALDLGSRQIVAIKEYFPSIWCHRQPGTTSVSITSEEYEYGLKHFLGESEILASLQHIPEVVRLYDSFSENSTAYYVMEFLEGETLQRYLRKHNERISFTNAVTLLMPAILGLRKVHLAGATHRDISPDNTFLCKDETVRIIDFGASASKDSYLSRSFIPVEKEGYSPPEQHTISSRGDSQGPWSDVYAMAGTIYRCTVGIRPPSSSSRLAGDPLTFEHSGLSQAQIHVLTKNLSLKPEERCRDMLRFARELLSCMKESEAAALKLAYRELADAPSVPSRNIAVDDGPSTPLAHQESVQPPAPPVGRQVLAFFLDMFFFQLVPYALGQLIGGTVWLWLLLGYVLGVLVTWLMTTQNANGGPGELLCGLEVYRDSRKPAPTEALLYCLIRLLWPLKPAEGIYLLATHGSLNAKLSGCGSLRRGAGLLLANRSLVLMITDGFYQGSTIPISPGRYVFGRNPQLCNYVYPMAYNVVSRVHVELVIDAANNIFVTNRSNYGTWVNNRMLHLDETVKADADVNIAFGKEKMVITYA